MVSLGLNCHKLAVIPWCVGTISTALLNANELPPSLTTERHLFHINTYYQLQNWFVKLSRDMPIGFF